MIQIAPKNIFLEGIFSDLPGITSVIVTAVMCSGTYAFPSFFSQKPCALYCSSYLYNYYAI